MASANQLWAVSCKPRNSLLSPRSSSTPNQSHFSSLSFSTGFSHFVFSKGCLSMSNKQRPIRRLVICMARRYAPDSRLRKIKARKRGGDPEKKRTRRRKRTGKRKGRGDTKKNKHLKVVKLVSSAGTGYFYANKRNTKNKKKLEINKYDPDVKRHVKFAEVK